jgi:serine O-acetyltransferase
MSSSLPVAKKLFDLRSRLLTEGPQLQQVGTCVDLTLAVLFPQFCTSSADSVEDLQSLIEDARSAFRTCCAPICTGPNQLSEIVEKYTDLLPELHAVLSRDAEAIFAGDPAAKSVNEVLSCYPGFLAIAIYRLAHRILQLGIPVLPRMMSEVAHSRTGIEIHPGARIGHSFVIDHGTGIVIGETTEIRDNVKLYQGVTLGALSVHKDLKDTKRHPTIESDVVIYANATILGGDTTVGAGSIIGGNVWLTKSVPANSRIYHHAE